MLIYLAGASKEVERCQAAIRELEEQGHVITHDWTHDVTHTYAGFDDDELGHGARYDLADADIDGVRGCELLVMLVPRNQSVGAWVELGIAIGLRKRIAMVGDEKRSIFLSHTHHQFSTDRALLDHLREVRVLR